VTFKEILAQVIDWLQQDKRLSYRALKRQFALADDYLDDLKAELIEVRGLARDEDGQVLVWTGPAPATRTGVPAAPTVWTPLASIPPSLAGNIRTFRSTLAAERKDVTVLFADLKGSMELLAGRDPEEARQLLDPVLERMMAAVHRYGGTVNQVLGDGIMALFGAPMAQADHAVRACYAALAMREAIRSYAEAVRRTHGITVQIRVGLSSGEVVVRAIGNDLHMDYTAIGQTTHLAARMEQLAHPGRTLLTAATLRLVEGRVQVRALGSLPVKGLDAPVEVFALVGACTRRGRFQVRVAGGLRHCVGRAMSLTSASTPLPLGTQRRWALSEPSSPGRCSRWPRPGRGRSPPCPGTARRVPRLRACRVALPLR
jgi:class 3 adenylate cyclase